MRALASQSRVTIEPGRAVRVEVEVTNTAEVIDGVVVTVEGGSDALTVACEPPLLPLFPEGSGKVTLALTVSNRLAAGTHDVVVSARSTVNASERVDVPLQLDVVAVPAARMEVVPPVQSGRSHVSYTVTCDNTGNTPLEFNLAASDTERSVASRFEPAVLTIGPGVASSSQLTLRARRHIFGGEKSRQVAVLASSRHVDLDSKATFRQPALIANGARTAIILGVIVALWAAVFVVGLHTALSKDPLTKDAPASFYAASSPTSRAAASSGGSFHFSLSAAQGAAPAGAVPKSGVVVGVGGTVDGTVTAASTGEGIGRITVEAIEDTAAGPQLISSAATANDGTYSLVGLLPGPYKLLFTADGYTNVWYPSATTDTAARPVQVHALASTMGINAVITGKDGSVSGSVDTGQTPSPPVTVTVEGLQGSTGPITTVKTDSQGKYTIPDLPAPGTYDLSFSATGYEVGSDTVDLAGGQHQIATTVDLAAGSGTFAGTVSDASGPLGGVTITASANGTTTDSATPTTGAVGHFAIPNLPTPQTYLLSFTKAGYGTKTVAEHLGPGQSIGNLKIVLAGGAGTVSGTVRAPNGSALGGVTVKVGGSSTPITTQTLTAGSVGTYELTGLATPSKYTLTFTLAGYASETIGVQLSSNGSATKTDVTLPIYSAGITGRVTSGGHALTGVSVSLTAGGQPQTTVTASSPPGGYSFNGLTPETYSLTFSLKGYVTQTALVTVQPGQTATQNISLKPES